MGLPKRVTKKPWTYKDYCGWPEGERWELIDGVAYDMTPTPSREHSLVAGEIYRQISTFLLGKNCEPHIAPFDVRLPDADECDDEIISVVQPDVVVVCDQAKLDTKRCRKAPDLAVEVLSPSTAKKDRVKKLELYERHGVKEFWVVHPLERILWIYKLKSTCRFGEPKKYSNDQKVNIGLFPGFELDLGLVFARITSVVKEAPRNYLVKKRAPAKSKKGTNSGSKEIQFPSTKM